MITLQQAFYGRRQRGYQLLASSNTTYNQKIEALCSAIGTPDGVSNVEPFYLNYVDGSDRYMIRCCIGNPDDAGRKTLFFHIFIGSNFELQKANWGIASLIHSHLFKGTLPQGPIFAVNIEEDNYSLPWGNTEIPWNHEHIAIISKQPELSLITGLLKNNINNISWASFSFRPLNEFDVYVISEFVALPSDRKCLSTSGQVIQLPSYTRNKQEFPSAKQSSSKETNKKKTIPPILFILVLSLVGNLFLGYLLTKNKSSESTNNHAEMKTGKTTVEIPPNEPSITKSVTREDIIKELRDEFLSKYTPIRGTWEEQMNNSKTLHRHYNENKNPLLINAGGYIDFVNQKILQETNNE